MLWPLTRRRHVTNPQLAQRIDAVRNQNPESERWLMLVEAAFAEADENQAWADAVLTVANERPIRAPLLHQSQIAVRRRVLHRWVREVLDLGDADGSLEPVELLEAALCQDDSRLETPELRVVAQMAALPLLQTCGRALAAQVPSSWWEGYCPVCGAWPTLAEFRGLERKRWLRCGRCATGWEVPWLRFPSCDEPPHTTLGYPAPGTPPALATPRTRDNSLPTRTKAPAPPARDHRSAAREARPFELPRATRALRDGSHPDRAPPQAAQQGRASHRRRRGRVSRAPSGAGHAGAPRSVTRGAGERELDARLRRW